MAIRSTPNSTRSPLNIVGSSTFGRYNYISSEKTYNLFISDDFLVNFAGWKRVLELLPAGEGRGLFKSIRANIMIAVINSNVYRVELGLGHILLGSLSTDSGKVYMDENLNNQICIVDGLKAYIYYHRGAPLIVPQTTSGFVPKYVCYHNTYFLFGNNSTSSNGANWYVYSPNTNTTIVQDSVQALQTKPDFALAVKRLPGQGNNVIVFGSSVCEIWTQTPVIIGSTRAAYRRNETINVDYGCLNVSTIASCEEYVAWLGINESNTPVIMVYTRQGAKQLSSDGINHVLDDLFAPEDSVATFYKQDGHLFYQITFFNKKDNLTLIYDFNTEKFFHLSDSHLNFHPAVDVVYFNQRSYFVSLLNGSLYELNSDFTTYDENIDDNDPDLINEIQRIRICKNIRSDDSARFIANQLVLTIEQGNDPAFTGLSYSANDPLITEITLQTIITEDGIEIVDEDSGSSSSLTQLVYRPRVDLSLSYDGGVTFGNTVSREMNPLGYRKNMMTWEKMGAANDLTCKFRFWGTGRFIVNDGFIEIY